MADLYFTQADVWSGGFYELALEIGPRSDENLYEALKMLWQHPALEGCYLESGIEPAEQACIAPFLPLVEPGHLFGLAMMPNVKRVVCGSVIVRSEGGSDWLNFYIPMGSLEKVYQVDAYPFVSDESSIESWRTPIDTWLMSIGAFIFQIVPFQLGLIGFEVSGDTDAQQIQVKGIPSQRRISYLWPVDGELHCFAQNLS